MPNLAFIFPGQGSQSLEMLSSFADTAVVMQTFEQASDVIGYDLWKLCQEGPVETLIETDKTQPALLTASVALWNHWKTIGPVPSMMAGHSLGEYSALVCAGILDFNTAVKLVEKRGQLMKQAVPAGVGKMAAIIGLDNDKIQLACEESAKGQVVSPVNYNSPGQTVIAGNADAVERAMQSCIDAGAKRALPLAVSVPSHCMLMKSASDELFNELSNISLKQSDIKVINNVDVKIETSAENIKDALVRQLYCPVNWFESVELMVKGRIDTLVECGPGKVLSGLSRRIDRSINSLALQDLNSLNQSVESFN
ncbi:MAG: [acyl-carrier-protein] S-malonyltransferase [Gammaproteobacteria bacterium]|nr:MAG: [acyl-carrier-protein] S-malonyltransferase [Gammaproteobacteria bacterium]